MIKNASDLLTAFIAKEREKVEAISMQHMPTLGSAYEAIAKRRHRPTIRSATRLGSARRFWVN